MKNRFIISSVLLLLVLSNFSALAAESFPDSHSAEILKTDQPGANSTWPASDATLISLPSSGESGADFRDQLPKSNSEENYEGSASLDHLKEYSYRNSSFVYLSISNQVFSSQNTKKLIFPFHTYL